MTRTERDLLDHLNDNTAGLTLHVLEEDLDVPARDLYRALKVLVRNGSVAALERPDIEPVYQLTPQGRSIVRVLHVGNGAEKAGFGPRLLAWLRSAAKR